MEDQLANIQADALAEIERSADGPAIDAVRVKYLGRAGLISVLSEGMKSLPKEERPRIGKLLNDTRNAVTGAIDARKAAIEAGHDLAALAGLDFTLPGLPVNTGALHPVTQLADRAIAILRRMGFSVEDGPDIDTEWHCFDALNTPADHPARNEQDTFYLPDGRLLRTHTSTIQVRTMERLAPPIRIIGPGAAYRRDETDATHLAQFNQIEGLYVAEGVSVADLKGTLEEFVRELFGPDAKSRFRPHFFPFTEPSFEIDIMASSVGGQGKWLELAGCGMVDPAVFDNINAKRGDLAYDSEKVSGFAFGFGLDRLAMVMAAIPDIRLFAENDIRVLAQFR